MDDFEVMLRQELGVGDPQELLTDEIRNMIHRSTAHTAWKYSAECGGRHVWYSCCGRTMTEAELLMRHGQSWNYGAREGRECLCPMCRAPVVYHCRGRIKNYSVDEKVHALYLPTRTGGTALAVVWAGTRWYRQRCADYRSGAAHDELTNQQEEMIVTEIGLVNQSGPDGHWKRKLAGVVGGRPGWGEYGQTSEGREYCEAIAAWAPIKSLRTMEAQTVINYTAPPTVTHTTMMAHALPEGRPRYAWLALLEKGMLRELRADWSQLSTVRLLLRQPMAEQAIKGGMLGLIQPETGWERRVVNLRARSIKRMTPLTSDELARLRRSGGEMAAWMLIVPYWARKLGQPIKLERGMEAVRRVIEHNINGQIKASARAAEQVYALLADYGERLRLTRMVRYMRRLDYRTLDLWRDTLSAVFRLYPECEDTALLFPQDLQRVHDEMHNRLRVAGDKKTNEACRRACERLAKKWTFEQDGLRLSPFEDMAEILREGSRQHICIGTYATRYGAGQTILLKLRRADAPEEPWHAVEVTKDGKHLVQCRGERNQTWEDEEQAVRGFWAAFDKARGTDFAQGLALRIKKREEKAG